MRNFLIVMFLILSLFSNAAYAMGDSPKECAEDVYIKFDDYIFKVPRARTLGIFYQDELFKTPCLSSLKEPIRADRFNFTADIKVPGYEKTYQAQFLFSHFRPDHKNLLQEIKSAQKEKGEMIQDLPLVDTFYRFPLSETYQTAYYVATNQSLKDINGNPIVVVGCGPETKPKINFVNCNVGFEWQSNVYVKVREIGTFHNDVPEISSIDTWNQIFPIYLEVLEKHIVKKSEGERL